MKATYYLFALALATASCRSTRPAAVPAVTADATAHADSVVVTPHRSLVDKVIGRKPTPYKVVGGSIKTGKKSTVNVYHGPATVSTNTAGKNAAAGTGATTAAKADAPVATTGATATDNTKAGQRGGAAATAPNATATATTIKPPTPWLKYGLWAAGALGLYWVLFGGGAAVLLALWRRNKPSENQA